MHLYNGRIRKLSSQLQFTNCLIQIVHHSIVFFFIFLASLDRPLRRLPAVSSLHVAWAAAVDGRCRWMSWCRSACRCRSGTASPTESSVCLFARSFILSLVVCSFAPGSGTASLTELLVVLGDHLPLEGLCAWPLSQEGVADDLAPRDRVVVVVASSNLTRVEEVPELALSSSNWCCSWSLGSWRAHGSWQGDDGFLWPEKTSFSI